MRRTRSFARRQASWFRRDPRGSSWAGPGDRPPSARSSGLRRGPWAEAQASARRAPELRDCRGALHQTRRGGQRLHRRPRSRPTPSASSVGQVRLLCDRRRGIGADGIIRVGPGAGRLRPVHGAAQRRRGRGRDERQRHPLPGPGRGRCRPGDAAPLHRGHDGRRPHGRLRGRGGARLGPGQRRHGPGDARAPISPRTSRTAGPARWTWATRISSCWAPRWRASTSRRSGPSCSPPSPAGSTWSGSA